MENQLLYINWEFVILMNYGMTDRAVDWLIEGQCDL